MTYQVIAAASAGLFAGAALYVGTSITRRA
jgi:hypothetical protein